jgi:mannose-6-phosphate isomerase
MQGSQRIYKLKGVIQHYSWGGYDFIPGLLNIGNGEKKPFAEYWLGAHPNHPSKLEVDNEEIALDAFLKQRGMAPLPFLLKVLDVRQMLSIQVHPDKKSAEKGYEDENKKGIALTAANRNYKDENHKPELMVALGDFWLLHGFRPAAELAAIMGSVNEFKGLSGIFGEGNYKALYEAVMRMPQKEVNDILKPLIDRILTDYEAGILNKNNPHFWAARAFKTFCKDDNYDRGIFSVYFFNLLNLKPGEGIYQPAGLPHAYLEGLNVEIMANSDNVLRAGLTDKHVDIEELMKHVRFEATYPDIIVSTEASNLSFAPPVKEFLLDRYSINENLRLSASAPEICILIEGALKACEMKISKGEAFFLMPGTEITLESMEPSVLFRAAVPAGLPSDTSA